jgi:flagellar basal body-associated protein FliL
MKKKLLIFTNLLYFFSTVPTFAHGVGEAEKTSSSLSIWVYAILTLFLLSLIGYAYAFYLKKRLNQKLKGQTQKEMREIKQGLNKKRGQLIKISSFILAIGFLTSIIWLFPHSNNRDISELQTNVNINVETFTSEGTGHINLNDPTPEYKTFPPTSGPHHPQSADYGYYEEPLPFELLVHNLEHGDIVIYYQPALSEETKEHLKYLSTFTEKGSGVIVVPNDDIEGEVVATAWTKKMMLPLFDEEKLGQFIYEFIYEGPEKLAPRN